MRLTRIDVNDGTFGLYTEVAAKQGKFDGYVKPIIKNLDILGKDDRDDNIFKKMWEGVAGAVTELLENQPRDQFATKIPIQGSFEQANTNISFAVLSILRNAFIQALQPSIDYQINIANVDGKEEEKEGFLKRLFGGDDDEDKKQ